MADSTANLGSFSATQRAPRVTLDAKTKFKPRIGGNVDGVVRDVSENGAYLVSKQIFSIDTEVVLYLDLPIGYSTKLCIVSGRIVRKEASPAKNLYGYGVAFDLGLARGSRDTLRQFVSSKLSMKSEPKS